MRGLAARVADPLWLIGRQWQLDELTAEDTGSAVRVDLTVKVTRLSRYRPGLPDGIAGVALDSTLPLEMVVEAEPAPALALGDGRAAAVAGAKLLALLGSLGARLRAGLVAVYSAPSPPADTFGPVLRRAELLRRMLPDGRLLYRALAAARDAGDPTTALPGLDRGDANAVAAARSAAISWLSWYSSRTLPGDGAPPAWRPRRLTHQASVAASGATPAEERVFVADGHPGGPMDWWAFDQAPGTTLGANNDPASLAEATARLASGLVFRGMPAARFWEFEAGDVNLGAISAAPEDLGLLLLTEFSLLYANDFFVLPVEARAGAVVIVQGLSVYTAFGERIEIPTVAAADVTAKRAPFRMFVCSTPQAEQDVTSPPLLIPNVAVGRLEGVALEEMLLSRDEMANIVWAIERTVPGIDGRPMDRQEANRRAASDAASPEGPPRQPRLAYQLSTSMPANWLPMLPLAPGQSGLARPVLRLAGALPLGKLLGPTGEVYPERLAHSGLLLNRRVRRARATDGRVLLWTVRDVSVGRGESASGLRFDQLVSR
ncbi:MAG TPA: hypothetical protein VGC80_04180 [Acetobacteraceae bacterium]|jgi:hypothetical protein